MTKTLGDIGGFELLEELGRGGMGVVYRARDHALKRELAVKLLSGGWTNDVLMLQRFLREAQILASINHPHVISIYAVGEHLGAPYFAMELLEHSIGDACKLKAPTFAQLKRWMLEAARGLGALHDQGIIHRDIKPGNLLLSKAHSLEPERVKVADLGIASSGELFGPRLTQLGVVLGTTGYLAPEAMQPELNLDSRADQYSLGVVFFELLARRAPFTEMERATAIRSGNVTRPRVPDIRQARPELDPATAQLITRMLEFDRNARFPDTHTLIAALLTIQEPDNGLNVSAPPFREFLRPTPAIDRAIAAIPIVSAKRTQLTASLFAVICIIAFTWFNTTRVRTTATPIATHTPSAPLVEASDTQVDGPALLGASRSLGTQRGSYQAPQTGLAADGETTTTLGDPELWAKTLLARYRLISADQTNWVFVLIDQQGGVIDAQLSGAKAESQVFSGRVNSHRIEFFDEVPWDIYELRFKSDEGHRIKMRIESSDKQVTGGGSYFDGTDRLSFKIESSE